MIKAKLLAIGLSIFTIAGLFSTNAYSFIDENEVEKEISSDEKPTLAEEMAHKPVTLTDATFDEAIKEGVVLVDFWAPRCPPCRRMAPDVDAVANEYFGKAKVAKIDIDKNSVTARKFYIRSIPTIIVFKDGKVQERVVGQQSREKLNALIKRYL